MGWLKNFMDNGGIRGAVDNFRIIVLDSNDCTHSPDLATAVTRIKQEQRSKIEDAVEKAHYGTGQSLRELNRKADNLRETIGNVVDANNPVQVALRLVVEDRDLQLGDHLVVQRFGYTHHGLSLGGGRVAHYLPDQGIIEDTLVGFADGAKIHRRESALVRSGSEAARRARRRIGEDAYNLFQNNCENFVTWCRSGPDF